MGGTSVIPLPAWTPYDDCYVYTLANSLTGLVFYVGKGQGKRVQSHIVVAAGNRKNPSRVALEIRSIWSQGGKVIIRKPHAHIHELQANELEAKLIEHYGYEQLLNQEWHACHKNQWKPPKGVRNTLWLGETRKARIS